MCGRKKEPSLSKYLGIRKAAYKGLKLWSFYIVLYKNLVLVLQNSLQIKTEILPHLVSTVNTGPNITIILAPGTFSPDMFSPDIF